MVVSTDGGTGSSARARRRFGGGVAALALGATACAGGGDGGASVEIEATAAGVADAAARSAEETYRFEMAMSFGGGDAVPVASGAADGDRFEMTFDLGEMFEALGEQMELTERDREDLEEMRAVDLSMEMVGDASVWYLRAPFFAEIAEGAPPDADPDIMRDFTALRDEWGRIDVEVLDDLTASDLTETLGGSQMPTDQEFLDLLSEVADVEELGTGEVRGDEVTGLAADVRLADAFEASGLSQEELASDAETDEELRALLDLTLPIEVWVDDDGLIRRTSYTLDLQEIAEATGEDIDELADEATERGLDVLDLGFTIDFFDHGDSITIEFPDDAIDLTDTFETIAEEAEAAAEADAKAQKRLDEIDARLGEIDTRFDEIDARRGEIDAEWNALEARDKELQAENDTVITGPTSLEQVRRLDEILEEQLGINDQLASLADEQLALQDEWATLFDEQTALTDEQTALLDERIDNLDE